MALHQAARVGDEQEVRELLAAGASPSDALPSNGWLPLHYAAYHGHEGIVRLLLEADAATAAALGLNGWAPLHLAAEDGQPAIVRMLLDAAPATRDAVESSSGKTPLHFAAASGMTAVAQMLVDAAPASSAVIDHYGCTPLHLAATFANPEIVQLLLQLDTSSVAMAAADNDGCTPLQEALILPHGRNDGPERLAAAHFLVQAAPMVQPALDALNSAGQRAANLYADLASRLALSQEQWQSIPAPCPDLARALPAVLERSLAEAGWLVGRLGQKQREWLRTAALSLARASAGPNGGCELPAELMQRILMLAFVPK